MTAVHTALLIVEIMYGFIGLYPKRAILPFTWAAAGPLHRLRRLACLRFLRSQLGWSAEAHQPVELERASAPMEALSLALARLDFPTKSFLRYFIVQP